jgi:undecaprenyl-diphosphatase
MVKNMSIFIAIVLGAAQGLTEFLPVSSSGHLVLLQRVFGIAEPALFFDTMVHVGTLAAVFAALWRDLGAILRRPLQPLTGYLIAATLPAVVFALAGRKVIESAFESGKLLGAAFLITALLLAAAELLARRAGGAKTGEMRWHDALVIGVLQAAAIIPGVSRSGATLSGALSRGLDRGFAARFSFLLSIPAILGALVLQLRDMAAGTVHTGGAGAAAIIAGMASAAIVGFFAVRLMLKMVRERPLWGFAAYTALLGLLILIDQFGTHLVF